MNVKGLAACRPWPPPLPKALELPVAPGRAAGRPWGALKRVLRAKNNKSQIQVYFHPAAKSHLLLVPLIRRCQCRCSLRLRRATC